jgi:drug/metabolite transporter superfamily protein YnfA
VKFVDVLSLALLFLAGMLILSALGCAPARSDEPAEPVVVAAFESALVLCPAYRDNVTDVLVYESGLVTAVDLSGNTVAVVGCAVVEVAP